MGHPDQGPHQALRPIDRLDHLNLDLAPGDVFGYIGPNGAGKSTTMKILAGLLEPSFGSALVLGKPVAGNGDFVRKSVGYMPDFIGVYEDLKVSEYLEFFASAYGIPRRQRRCSGRAGRARAGPDLKYRLLGLPWSIRSAAA